MNRYGPTSSTAAIARRLWHSSRPVTAAVPTKRPSSWSSLHCLLSSQVDYGSFVGGGGSSSSSSSSTRRGVLSLSYYRQFSSSQTSNDNGKDTRDKTSAATSVVDNNDDDDDDNQDNDWVPPPPPPSSNRKKVFKEPNDLVFPVIISAESEEEIVENIDWIQPDRPLIGDQMYQPADDYEDKMEKHVKQQKDRDDGDDDDKMVTLQKRFDQLSPEDQQRLQEEYEKLKQADREMMKYSSTATTATEIPSNEQEPSTSKAKKDSATTSVDWLKTRRSSPFGVPNVGNFNQPVNEQSIQTHLKKQDQHLGLIPILKHTLLTSDEIVRIIKATGGLDVVVIMEDKGNPDKPQMAGEDGIVVCTAPTHRHLGQISRQVVRQMRYRQLQEVGVDGAIDGPQGRLRDPQETWVAVDCRNYVVHVQMENTRKHINFELLYSGNDPGQHVNPDNDDEVDRYVAENLVPLDYGPPIMEWDRSLKKLERDRFTAPHRPVVDIKKKKRRRNKKKRK